MFKNIKIVFNNIKKFLKKKMQKKTYGKLFIMNIDEYKKNK